jgi:capsular exopolysaccharide synthesis family protein
LYYQNRLSDAEKIEETLKLDIQIVNMIEEYLKNSKNNNTPIPSNLDVNDLTFTAMINRYNELQVQRQKQSFSVFETSTIYKEIESQLKGLKGSILEAAENLKKAKQLRIDNFQTRTNEDMSKLAEMPDKEKGLQEISRQRQIKERLYLYLLQKREETAISSVSTTSNYQTLDAAFCSRLPIEPKISQIKTFAILLGLLLPIGIIYLLDLLNDKITTRNDISDKTDLPIVGEITHVDNNEEVVVENSRNVVAEQFRIFRSNLQFIMPKDANKKQAVSFLITSSVSGEGKSFISLNLACVLSLTGKKVALLEFDLRKLKSIKVPEVNMSSKGITNYLIGQTDNADEIFVKMDRFPNLSIYNTGPIPPNPAELIISSRMETLFAKLKAEYDYIVIDSAPIGLVSDSFALSQYADAVLYIVRQRYTFKKQLEFINDLKRDGKLHNLALVINDVNLAGRYGYYGYGYGYGYGYMYRYGFGYGYNRYIYGGKKNDPYFNINKKGYFDNPQKTTWWQRLFGK